MTKGEYLSLDVIVPLLAKMYLFGVIKPKSWFRTKLAKVRVHQG